MELKENYDVNKPFFKRAGRAKKAAPAHALEIGGFVVQTQASHSDEISEFSNDFEENQNSGYNEDEDSDDDMTSGVESVVAVASRIKRRMGKQGTAVEKARRPLQKLVDQEANGRSTNLEEKKFPKLPKSVALKREENGMNEEVSQLHSSCSHLSGLDFLGDETSSEIQALADQADLLAPAQHLAKDAQVNKAEEIVMLLLKELSKQSVMVRALNSHNEDAMKKICFFEQLVREKDQELEDCKYYNEMNDCANKKMLDFAGERYEKQLNEQKQRVANLVAIIQRQQIGESEYVDSLIREKCLLQKELLLVKKYLAEEASSDKQHLKRVKIAIAAIALVSACVGFAAGLDSFLYVAPFYFLFVFFVVV